MLNRQAERRATPRQPLASRSSLFLSLSIKNYIRVYKHVYYQRNSDIRGNDKGEGYSERQSRVIRALEPRMLSKCTHIHFSIPDKILATLGEGTFGKVVKVKDLQM